MKLPDQKTKGLIEIRRRDSLLRLATVQRHLNSPKSSAAATTGEKVLLTRQGLATALSCSLRSVDHLQNQGMPCLRVGRGRRFVLSEVISWLKRKGGRL